MNLFFKDTAKTTIDNELLSGNLTAKTASSTNDNYYYSPTAILSTDESMLKNANTQGTLILNQLKVTNADFYISGDTTSDFGY
jgi:hypothetical protein